VRYLPALLIGRLIRFAVRLVRPGGGSALPGLVVSKLAPNLVYKTLSAFPKGYVSITGTAGKSTTTKMVVAIVRAHGVEVFTNPSTANIEQGFFSTIVRTGNLRGKVPGSIAILEMDEAHAANVAKRVKPRTSVILNVLEDQLDRFVDPASVRETLTSVALNTSGRILLNADDQNCLQISLALRNPDQVSWFGFSEELNAQSDLHYAPTYLAELPRPNSEATVLSRNGKDVSVEVGGTVVDFKLPSRGAHFALDAVAAVATSREILGDQFNPTLAASVLDDLPPVFSRGEVRKIEGELVEFILVQNPPSMQLNLDNLEGSPDQILFAIGRDVHDPSWLWTVDYSKLGKVSMVSGFNFADATLVLKYNGVLVERVEADYFKAIDDFLALPKPNSGHKTVLYSADAMRRLRRYKGFTDPEDVTRG
jgi:UDP-N-acetylmuramyl pentapeptide synthase